MCMDYSSFGSGPSPKFGFTISQENFVDAFGAKSSGEFDRMCWLVDSNKSRLRDAKVAPARGDESNGKIDKAKISKAEYIATYGKGGRHTDIDASEAACRAKYHGLVEKISKYERAMQVTSRLAEDRVDIQAGENTFIFSEEIDNGVIYAKENSKPEDVELLKASG